MHLTPSILAAALTVFAAPIAAQQIIAQSEGIVNPSRVIDFGANVLPNFTPVSTQFAGVTITHASYFTTGTVNHLAGGFLTNDSNAGQPNTLRIQFAVPIVGLSFVYHQIQTPGVSTIRAVLQGVTVSQFSGMWDQYQTNNYFGFLGVVFDELQVDFLSDFNVDTLAIVDLGMAACAILNGNDVNPRTFTCVAPPVLGSTWVGQVATNPNTVLTALGYAPAGFDMPTPLFGGEMLLLQSPPPIGLLGSGTYSMTIPNGPGWVGTRLAFQAFELRNVGPTTTVIPLNGMALMLGQ